MINTLAWLPTLAAVTTWAVIHYRDTRPTPPVIGVTYATVEHRLTDGQAS